MKLHHIGYVVRDIDAFAATMPALSEVVRTFDPLQQANLALFGDPAGTLFEFVQPLEPAAFTWGHLQKHGESYHHVCFAVADEAEVQNIVAGRRMVRIRGPIFATLLGKHVIFTMTRSRQIVEFVLDAG